MEMVATTTVAGWVRGKFHDFSTDEILPPQAVDRLEEDDALLSRAIVALHRLHHYPIIATTSHTMGATASADTVTLEDGVTFAVGGVVFDTHDLDTRVLTIPDGATRFLRAEVDAACGDLVDYGDPANGVQVDPLVRRLVCKLVLSEGAETDAQGAGGGPSSPTSMRILKAVKAAAGTVPEITLYAADGLDPATSVATHKAANPAHAAAAILFDNSIAALAGAPTRVQAAIEALTNLLVLASKDLTAEIEAHAVANPAHAAGAISFDNSVAGIIGGPTRVQTAIEALTSLLMSIANDHAAQIVAHAAANPAHAAGAISFDNSIAALAGSPTRVQAALEMLAARALPLAAKLVVYVRTDGNDSHDGSANDAAHAFATIQQAVNYVCSYNLGQVGADIHIAAGTYAEGVGLPRYNSRAGVVRLLGAGIDATVISHGTSYVAYGHAVRSAPLRRNQHLRRRRHLYPRECCRIHRNGRTVCVACRNIM